VLIGPLAGPLRDDADLIQRQAALSHAFGAAWELPQTARDRGDRVSVCRRAAGLPRHQRRHRPRAGGTPELVAIDLGDDFNDAPTDRVARTGHLRQLLEQPLKTLAGTDQYSASRCGRRHDASIAAPSDKFRSPA